MTNSEIRQLIEELRALEKAATPAPWRWTTYRGAGEKDWQNIEAISEHGYNVEDVITRDSGIYGPDVPTGDFIIAMRNAAPQLLDFCLALLDGNKE